MVTGGEINRAFDAQRKQDTIAGLKDHVIICGFGRIAQVMATHLAETEQKFIIIDNDKERIAISLNVLSNQHSMQSRYKAIAQSHFILPE
ncbi:MAG: NAD-binding protein [Cyanobacteria bacterium J06607_15]